MTTDMKRTIVEWLVWGPFGRWFGRLQTQAVKRLYEEIGFIDPPIIRDSQNKSDK